MGIIDIFALCVMTVVAIWLAHRRRVIYRNKEFYSKEATKKFRDLIDSDASVVTWTVIIMVLLKLVEPLTLFITFVIIMVISSFQLNWLIAQIKAKPIQPPS